MGVRGHISTRSSLCEPRIGESAMVYNSDVYRLPLLPFEKQLCDSIGLSEEEYKQFRDEVIKKGRVRPAGYEHIPDIRADVTVLGVALAKGGTLTAAGSIVVGVALTVAAYLLTPKPKSPKFNRRGLDSVNKAGRFNPTFGFDSAAELATYGEAIPIVFGKYEAAETVGSGGGILVSPRLVWSRMFSYGTQQAIKMAYVVGEQGNETIGLPSPELSGIFIGNNALDSIYASSFAFYWCPKSSTTHSGEGSRILTDHLQYGTRGEPADGDPNTVGTGDKVILCPTAQGPADTGFSAAYSLTNSSNFGAYAPIPNGTPYKVDWKTISWIKVDPGEDDPGNIKELEIRKITGPPTSRYSGMEGTGRLYSRRMGILYYHREDGTTITCSNADRTKVIDQVKKEDTCEFHIMPSDQQVRKNIYANKSGGDPNNPDENTKVKVDDINNEINSQREAADDALQVGEVFQIGRTGWQVFSRTESIWTSTNNVRQKVWLKCIDNNKGIDNQIGIVSEGVVNPDLDKGFGDTWIGDTFEREASSTTYGPFIDPQKTGEDGLRSTNFYPLMRRENGLIKNTRDTDITEIGIKSSVVQELSGLCNFNSLLTPSQLGAEWNGKVSVSSGTISSQVKRTSFFCIKFRNANASYNNDLEYWKDFGYIFAIQGSTGVDQYNWIRIKPPGNSTRYEYQFSPVPGSALYGKDGTQLIYVLKALASQPGQPPTHTLVSQDGFELKFNGITKALSEVTKNVEFYGSPSVTPASFTQGDIATVSDPDDRYIAGDETWQDTPYITQLKWIRNTGRINNTTATGRGRGNAFLFEIFGDADASTLAVGDEIESASGSSALTFATKAGNLPVRLQFKGQKVKLGTVEASQFGKTYGWKLVGFKNDARTHDSVVPITVDNKHNFFFGPDLADSQFEIETACSSNPFATNADGGTLTHAGIVLEVTDNAYKHDVVRGRGQGIMYELFGDAEAKNPGEIVEKQITFTYTSAMSGTGANWVTDILQTQSRTITIKFHGVVRKFTDDPGVVAHWTGRKNKWVMNAKDGHNGYQVISSTGSWAQGDKFGTWRADNYAFTGNPFWRTLQKRLGFNLQVTSFEEGTTTPETITADREFEFDSQYSDVSFYGNLVRKSNESSPEHTITYINESIQNEDLPTYDKTVTSVLAMKASRNFAAVDQIRTWLSSGISVKNLHPDNTSYANWTSGTPTIGPSNLFTDLLYYLLTDRTAGAGKFLGKTSSDVEDLIYVGDTSSEEAFNNSGLRLTSKFLRSNKLFCNGSLDEPINLRSYIGEMAPNFLCDFILADGRFSLQPAIPVNNDGSISTNAIVLKQLFTSGNIIEDTFEVGYINVDERRPFKAVIRYREEMKNQLPQEKTVTVRRASSDGEDVPLETFDLTDVCTSKEHAKLVGMYFLSIREHVKHTCSFSTTPYGINLAPGDLIRVTTETSPYNVANNGTIAADGTITSITPVANGLHEIWYYPTTSGVSDVYKIEVNIASGKVEDWDKGASIFSLVTNTVSQNVYKIEEITLSQENTVDIVASQFPCDEDLVSVVARELSSEANFSFEPD